MRAEHLVLGAVALATCLATYNSIHYLAWAVTQDGTKALGATRQLRDGSEKALTLTHPSPKPEGECSRH